LMKNLRIISRDSYKIIVKLNVKVGKKESQKVRFSLTLSFLIY
jgi:hypothetical protein